MYLALTPLADDQDFIWEASEVANALNIGQYLREANLILLCVARGSQCFQGFWTRETRVVSLSTWPSRRLKMAQLLSVPPYLVHHAHPFLEISLPVLQ